MTIPIAFSDTTTGFMDEERAVDVIYSALERSLTPSATILFYLDGGKPDG